MGKKLQTGLATILAGASILEELSLTMDKASMAMTAPTFVSDSYKVFYHISFIIFNKLQRFALSGWDVPSTYLQRLLTSNKNTLTMLSLSDCTVFGDWRDVLQELLGSTSLFCLRIHQVSNNFNRVAFPTTCITIEHSTKDNDWQEVAALQYSAGIVSGEDWDARLYAIVQDVTERDVLADPTADDAGYWIH